MAKIWDKIRRLRIAGATAMVALTVFASCHTTKFVPEGKYLLNKARIEVKDNPEISRKEMRNYLRQTQNHEVFGGWKAQAQRLQLVWTRLDKMVQQMGSQTGTGTGDLRPGAH